MKLYIKDMKKQVYNPYLPNYEYIPDGEPHVFDDRLYVFGSHDRFGAAFFCENDYVLYSAPVDDLSEWAFHDTIYRKDQDPLNKEELNPLFAPDACKGNDERYYLYYCPCNTSSIGVAVAEKVTGPYQFLGHVKDKKGQLIGRRDGDPYPFDPAVIVEKGKVYLYVGFSPDPDWDFMEREFGKTELRPGAFVMQLEEDMCTLKSEPEPIIIEECPDRNHDFFEASSIRRFDDRFYFIYSSWNSHELCYAIGNNPEGPFTYKGILHDNGDIGIVEEKNRVSYTGNNHGSLVKVKDNYYIFGHRHTNYSAYARQGVAEKVYMKQDGTFDQAEMTSCGLNNGPLLPQGNYGAFIACHLTSKKGAIHYVDQCDETVKENHPAFTQDKADRQKNPGQYIGNIQDGTIIGFKYFSYTRIIKLSVKTRGDEGSFEIRTDLNGEILSRIRIERSDDYKESETVCFEIPAGDRFALYFTYKGKGHIDFYEFSFN